MQFSDGYGRKTVSWEIAKHLRCLSDDMQLFCGCLVWITVGVGSILIFLLRVWAGKMTQWMACLLHRGEDQGFVPQKSLQCQVGVVACQ